MLDIPSLSVSAHHHAAMQSKVFMLPMKLSSNFVRETMLDAKRVCLSPAGGGNLRRRMW